MRVLVTGGAGYIGSHTVVQLAEAGHDVHVVDDFSNSHPVVMERLAAIIGRPIPLHQFDLCDEARTQRLFAEHHFDAVIHFAGLKAVGESVQQPLKYYRTNLVSTLSLVQAMQEHEVFTLVFSSSATVYGPDATAPMREDMPISASNPYGWTKVMIERMLTSIAATDPRWRIALLRYFNPVGAHASGTIGESPVGIPNNLVPYIAQVAVGRRPHLNVYGDDYDTPDGTCLRDYIHINDLASGHIAALNGLSQLNEPVRAWNLGTGHGTSVLEMLQAFERASERELPHHVVGRRAGDLPSAFADPSRAEHELGWKATHSVDDMCTDTWRWQSRNPYGYEAAPAQPATVVD
ncbi:HAUS augmin-like complex subunit 5 [Platysternon megacephalum]|uniref:UDP-glucose 4-epimerase n=1 Tax=Platysternon megacephalum TaxID=55544 RepID=A0A4D9DKM1_9SAUR|nr:HAUS augmin-like complex subunit 5 [Platysternon megacephalum]